MTIHSSTPFRGFCSSRNSWSHSRKKLYQKCCNKMKIVIILCIENAFFIIKPMWVRIGFVDILFSSIWKRVPKRRSRIWLHINILIDQLFFLLKSDIGKQFLFSHSTSPFWFLSLSLSDLYIFIWELSSKNDRRISV